MHFNVSNLEHKIITFVTTDCNLSLCTYNRNQLAGGTRKRPMHFQNVLLISWFTWKLKSPMGDLGGRLSSVYICYLGNSNLLSQTRRTSKNLNEPQTERTSRSLGKILNKKKLVGRNFSQKVEKNLQILSIG